MCATGPARGIPSRTKSWLVFTFLTQAPVSAMRSCICGEGHQKKRNKATRQNPHMLQKKDPSLFRRGLCIFARAVLIVLRCSLQLVAGYW